MPYHANRTSPGRCPTCNRFKGRYHTPEPPIDRIAIMQMLAEKRSYKEIAFAVRCSLATISRVRRSSAFASFQSSPPHQAAE